MKGFMEGQHHCEASIIIFGLQHRWFALSKTTFSALKQNSFFFPFKKRKKKSQKDSITLVSWEMPTILFVCICESLRHSFDLYYIKSFLQAKMMKFKYVHFNRFSVHLRKVGFKPTS